MKEQTMPLMGGGKDEDQDIDEDMSNVKVECEILNSTDVLYLQRR